MKKHRRARSLPLMMAELAMASWETIARRTALMTRGALSPTEYQRMVIEKAAALQQSAIAVMTGRGKKAALRPWHRRATSNARRLRRKS
jgi:hypothetical protein